MKNKKSNVKNKSLAMVITFAVIGLLILAGPVQGFNLSIGMDDDHVDKGDDVVFNVEIEIESGEGLPVEYLVLVLDGNEYIECKFDVEGNIVSGCKGVKSIVDTKEVNYGYGYNSGIFNGYGYYFGYGYGYGYGFGGNGKLSYEITINTEDYKTGFYDTKFIAKIGNKLFEKVGDKLKINYVYGGSGSSGSGSKDVDRICETEYVCSDWGVCINGYQTRLCQKERPACYSEDTPEILRSCSGNDVGIGNQVVPGTDGVIDLTKERSSSSGITGAVIGDGESRPAKLLIWISVLFVLMVLALLGILASKRFRGHYVSKYH